MPDAIRIFIAPPSEETLRLRLIGRGHETPEQIDARMDVAKAELAAPGRVPARRAQRRPRDRRRRARADRPLLTRDAVGARQRVVVLPSRSVAVNSMSSSGLRPAASSRATAAASSRAAGSGPSRRARTGRRS